MGVPGLWSLLEPARRPIELEHLSGKIIAIDMNIWLHQAVKSRAANAGPRTYLAVLFRRLCKLIYFGIRPIFVFDGEVPALKRATMAARRKLRGQLGDKAQRAQERLLRRLLRRVAEQSLTKSKSSPDSKRSKAGENEAKLELLRRLHQRPDVQQAMEDVQLFTAPTEQSLSNIDSSGLLHENAGLEYDELARDYLDGFNLRESGAPELDLHSDAFCALPLQAQLRVVQLAREQLDSQFRASRSAGTAEDNLSTETFSNQQIGRLLLRRRLAERQQQLAADLAREEAARQVARLNNPQLTAALTAQAERLRSIDPGGMGDTASEMCTTALRIQSHDTGHAILIKKSPLKPTTIGNSKTTMSAGTNLTLESLIQLVHQAQKQEAEHEEEPTGKQLHTSPTRLSSSLEVDTESSSEPTPVKAASTVNSLTPEIDDKKSSITEECSRPCRTLFHTPPELPSASTLDSCPPQSMLKSVVIVDAKSSGASICGPGEHTEDTKLPETVMEFVPLRQADLNNVKQDEEAQDEMAVATAEENDESDDDDEEDGFVEVPISDDPSAVKDEITDSSSSSSDDVDQLDTPEDSESRRSGSNTATVEIVEDWVEDEREDSFVLDDDVLREQADRFARQAQTTTAKCIAEAQELLQLFGMPFLTSPEEAEAQCATLQRRGHVDLVASDDSDVWPFGARQVCRHLFGGTDESRSDQGQSSKTRKGRIPSCYRLENVQQTLGLTVANILRLALLCGSDYTRGIQNVGPVTAVEILSEFARSELQSTEPDVDSEWNRWLQGAEATDQLIGLVLEPLKAFVDWWNTCGCKGSQINSTADQLNTSPVRRKWLKLHPPPDFPDPRIVQAYLRPNVKTDLQPFMWETPNVEKLVKHASSAFGWKRDTTESMLCAVLRRQQQRALGSVPRLITHYFESVPSTSATVPLAQPEVPDEVTLPSKRARNATSRLRLGASATHPVQPKQSTTDGDDPELSQLPYRTRTGRGKRRTAVHSKPIEASTNQRRSRKTTQATVGPRRRVVNRVALSDEEASD